MTDLHTRVVAALQSRLEVARAAGGRWSQPDADREHGRIHDENGEVVTYDESSPTEAQAAHIVANDPASTIRRIEAQLRVVERHRPGPVTGIVCTADSCWWPCADIRDLATGEGIEVADDE